MKRIIYIQSPSPLEAFSEACLCFTPKIFTTPIHHLSSPPPLKSSKPKNKRGESHRSEPNAYELFLDIGETQKVLGGEKKILSSLEGLTFSFDIQGQTVLTDRPEWARMFALGNSVIIPQGKSYPYLLKLPIGRVEYCGDPLIDKNELGERQYLISFMRRIGMHTILDFAPLSGQAINRRFGKGGIVLQEWITGKREWTLPSFIPHTEIKESVDAEDIYSFDALLFGIQEILLKMEARLCGRGVTAQELTFTFDLDNCGSVTKTLSLSEPHREANPLLRVVREFLQDTRWESPLQRLTLEISDTIPYAPGQLSLFDTTENRSQDLAAFVSRLQVQHGKEKVGFADLREDHLPEHSWKNVSAPPKPIAPQPQHRIAHRPPFLFYPPRPYSLPKAAHLTPSENLDTHWWEEKQSFRRYFIAETPEPDKEQLWIFWDLKRQEWFLHGSFS